MICDQRKSPQRSKQPDCEGEDRKSGIKYKSRLENNPNTLASNLVNSNNRKLGLKHKIPQDLFLTYC